MSRFVRDSASVFATQIAVTILGIGTSVVTARMLGPHDRGLFQLLVLLPATLANFVKLGIPQANVYFMRRERASAADVASNSVWFALALGGGLAIVAYLGRDWLLAPFLREAPPATVPVVLALVPCVLIQTFFSGVLQAEQRFREFNFQTLMPALLALLGMPIALVWLRTGLVGAIVTQTVIALFVTFWLALRVHRTAHLRLCWNGPLARGMLGFGGKSYVQTLASTLHFRIDQYMIAMFLDPSQVGLYAVAVNLTNLLLKVPDATGTVLYPRIAGAGEQAMHAQTTTVCRHTIFVMAVGALGYAIAGPFAIRLLYGEAFAASARPLLLMLPGTVMISLYLLLTRNFTSRNRQQVNIVAAVAALAINVGLNCILIPRFGIAGAAISTAVSYSVASLILLVMFVRESGYSVADTVLVGRAELHTAVRRARGLVVGATAE
ncbi:MAG TPA: flippase [Candidatus Binatia bacterium]|nr:flippase [Candidatus Binatia bacterium]